MEKLLEFQNRQVIFYGYGASVQFQCGAVPKPEGKIIQNMEKLLEFDHHREKLGDFCLWLWCLRSLSVSLSVLVSVSVWGAYLLFLIIIGMHQFKFVVDIDHVYR